MIVLAFRTVELPKIVLDAMLLVDTFLRRLAKPNTFVEAIPTGINDPPGTMCGLPTRDVDEIAIEEICALDVTNPMPKLSVDCMLVDREIRSIVAIPI